MKVGSQHDVRTVVIRSKFGIDLSRGFQSADPRKSAFPIEILRRLKTLPCANALACDNEH
jgi:hypothetical protein